MKDFWDIFNELDLSNITSVLVISVFLIIIFTSCIGPLWASNIEVVLMDKTDLLKRHSLLDIILLGVLALANYMFVYNVSFFVADVLLLILSVVIYVGIWIINRFDKFRDLFYSTKEFSRYMMIMTVFPMVTYVVSELNNINKISCAIICAVVEIMIIMIGASKYKRKDSEFMIKVSNEQWYVFHRMDDCLICGDAKKLNNSKKLS